MRKITNHPPASGRPMVLTGDGVMQAGTTDVLSTLGEQLQIPAVTTSGEKTSLSGLHAQDMVVIGRYAPTVSNQVLLIPGLALDALCAETEGNYFRSLGQRDVFVETIEHF